MPVGAAIAGAGILGAGASLYASDKQSDASANALAQQNAMYKQTQADLSPYKKVGQGALISLGQLYGIGADGKPSGQPYNPQALEAFRNSPDYKFAFDQGMQGLTFSNAAKGLLQSGSNLKDIVGFGQGLASQQFGKYVDRLSGLATMGQNSAAGGATNALGFAGAMGGTTMAGGQAAASGAVGAANALTGGVGSYLNYNQQQQNNTMLANALGNRNGGQPMDIRPDLVGGSNAVNSSNPVGLYADGGRPPVGRPIMVGEKGPEVFVPDQQQQQKNSWQPPWQGGSRGGQFGSQPNGLAAAVDSWQNLLRKQQFEGQPNGLLNAWGNMFGGAGGGQFGQGGQPTSLSSRLSALGGFGAPGMGPGRGVGDALNAGNGLSAANSFRGLGGLPGFADGGRPPVGEPIVVGEQGPEVIQMDQPGTVVPNHELPLWLESGMEDAPPYHPPMTRAVDDYSSRDPNELATMRMRGNVRPDAGRADFPINHLANMALGAGAVAAAPYALPALAYTSPEFLAARLATKAPALAAGGLGAVYAGSPTAAGEQEFRWVDQDTGRTKEMADILNRVNGRAAQITTLGTTKTPSPAGTQAKVIEQLTALNHPEGADMKRLAELRKQADDERQGALEQFTFEKDRARQQAEAKRKAEQSWFDMVPGSRSLITPAMMAGSYYGGKWLGNRYGMPGAMTAGAVGGGVEGFLGQFLPTEIDYAGLPETSPAYQKAERNLDSLDWWKRVGLISAGNAALGAYGGFKGVAGRRPVLTTPPPAGPSLGPNMPPASLPPLSSMGANPAMPQNGLAAASQALPLPQTPNALATASVMVVKDKNGRTLYMNRSGGFAKKEDIERFLNSKASQ